MNKLRHKQQITPFVTYHLCVCSRIPIQVFEVFFTIFFTTEMMIRMGALGLRGREGYFSIGWNRLDFVIVVLG